MYAICLIHSIFLTSRYDAAHHKFILTFFKSVATSYQKRNAAADFVLDLLQLGVHRLFSCGSDDQTNGSVASEFSEFLRAYILQHKLQTSLLKKMQKILVSFILHVTSILEFISRFFVHLGFHFKEGWKLLPKSHSLSTTTGKYPVLK